MIYKNVRILVASLAIIQRSQQQDLIPVDVPGPTIPTMANYVPSAPNYPKDYRILDCW